jgi:hypothetical protein
MSAAKRKPRISSPCLAERYNGHNRNSRIVEFFDPELQKGGLIEFRRTDDGRLLVLPYCLSEGVEASAATGKKESP